MTIRAVLRQGVIQPIEPLPSGWREGQELVVEEPIPNAVREEINQWGQELDEAVAQIPAEEHDRFLRALEENEQQSKDAVRKQWEQE